MVRHWRTQGIALAGAALIAAMLAFACSDDPAAPEDALEVALDDLRAATAAYRSRDAALAAGFIRLTPCWYHGNTGAMGYHYGRLDLIGNGTVELLEPEVVMYEPRPDGSFALVGVEYIVPIPLWQGSAPPTLLDEVFFRDDAAGLFTLHIWHERENPAGVFAPWNPDVTCAHAAESEDLGAAAHH